MDQSAYPPKGRQSKWTLSMIDASGSMMPHFEVSRGEARKVGEIMEPSAELMLRSWALGNKETENGETRLMAAPRDHEMWERIKKKLAIGAWGENLERWFWDAATWAQTNGVEVERVIMWTDTDPFLGKEADMRKALDKLRDLGAKEFWVVMSAAKDDLPRMDKIKQDLAKSYSEPGLEFIGFGEALARIKAVSERIEIAKELDGSGGARKAKARL